MKYTTELMIELPRDRVAALFDNPDNLAKWQPGLQEMQPISGEPGTAGAKTRLVYDENGRKVNLVETIISRDLPDEFTALYETNGVRNWSANHFYAEGPKKTRWVQDNEFKFGGLMALFAIFMRGAFPKQTLKDMKRFRTFAEYNAGSEQSEPVSA